MKCPYVPIFFFAFAIQLLQLTNAAPLYNIDSILDELLEMNIRMGDVILRAKYEYGQLKSQNLKDTLGKLLIQKSPIIQSTEYGTSTKYESQSIDSIKEITATSEGRDAEKEDCAENDNTKKIERSFIGRTFDTIGNHWNNWFKKKFTDVENIIEFEPSNQLIDDRNANSYVLLEKSADDTDSVNIFSNNYDSSNINLGNIDLGNAESNSTDSGNVQSDNTDSDNLDFDNIDAGDLDLDDFEAGTLDLDNIDAGNLEAGKPDNIEIGKPNNIEVGKPDNIKSGKPDNIEAGKPDNVEAGKPDNVEAGKPDNIEAGKPDNIEAGKPDNIETGKPDNIGAGKPDNIEAGKADNIEAGKPDNIEAGNADSGNVRSEYTDSGNVGSENTDSGDANSDNQIENSVHEADYEQDWGEETSNNESKDVGWFDSAIDSIVNFFS